MVIEDVAFTIVGRRDGESALDANLKAVISIRHCWEVRMGLESREKYKIFQAGFFWAKMGNSRE